MPFSFLKYTLRSFGFGCIYCALSTNLSAAELHFSGYNLSPIIIHPERTTGLNNIYVLNALQNVSVSYTSESSKPAEWYTFSNLGAAFDEPLTDIIFDGNKSTLTNAKGNLGYKLIDGDRTYYFWIVDYSKYPLNISYFAPSMTQECDRTILDIEGEGNPIHYYTINGKQETLSRDIKIVYNNLVWDDTINNFRQEEYTKVLSYISPSISITPPIFCPTNFTLIGDRFLQEWHNPISLESINFHPISVTASTEATQEIAESSEDMSNKIPSSQEGMGGSAPSKIFFRAYISDAIIHNEWQMSSDEEFDHVTHRINSQDFDYIFTEEGTTYVRYVGSNSDGSCEVIGEVYTVNIGSSELKIPNAFSPNNDGINDEWKVSYRSLINFKCWIFDINGHEIFSFDDPSKGWDGKSNGKIVPSGVYYYVIQATGSDGKRYKKSGDINIINYKGGKSSSNQN